MIKSEKGHTKISLLLPADQKDILDRVAQKNDLTLSQVLRKAVKEFVKKEEVRGAIG